MKAVQILFVSGGSRFGTRTLGGRHHTFLREVGARPEEIVDLEFPFDRPVRPARRTGTLHASLVDTIRRFRALRPMPRVRDRLSALLGGAERTLVLAGGQGLQLLHRCELPPALLRRASVIAYGPVCPELRAARPVLPGARLLTVRGRGDRMAARSLQRPDATLGCGRMDCLDDPGFRRIVAEQLVRLRAEAAQELRERLARPARIALLAPPFSGHMHPLLGLAAALRGRGCRVLVCSTADRRAEVEGEGLELLPLLPGRQAEVHALAGVDHRSLRALLRMPRDLRSAIRLMEETNEELVAGLKAFRPDALVADMTQPLAGAAAERLGCLWITCHPSPCAIETADGPPGYCGGPPPARTAPQRLRELVLRAASRLAKDLFFQISVRPEPTFSRFPGPRRADGSERSYSPSRILCLGDRRLELARRWPRAVRFTGPILFTPRAALAELGPAGPLRRGDRPLVLCTFGTHLPHVKRELPEVMRRAAQLAPDADIVLAAGGPDPIPGFAGFGADPVRENLRLVPYLDYARLEEAHLVVHHAGAGASWAAIASGRRQIVLPVDYDQPDFAERLRLRGLAVRLRDPSELPAAIRAALDAPDPAGRVRAEWRERVRSADGAGRAAEQILLDLGRAAA